MTYLKKYILSLTQPYKINL